ncbi:MAG TPA: hypothetical protein PLK77_12855 [Pyrinomonadaceae bacterium]|nr:hypothetical protein [Pyrinomonadaceae bacterium]
MRFGSDRCPGSYPTRTGIKYADTADIPVSPGGEIEDEAFDRSKETYAIGE